MTIQLRQLRPGSRFNLAGMPEVWGELIECSDCSAKVKLLGGVKAVEFENHGVVRKYCAQVSKVTTWAPGTEVEPWGD